MAAELLNTYRARLALAGPCVSREERRLIEMKRALVARLAALDPSEAIVVRSNSGAPVFTLKATGEVLADLHVVEEAAVDFAARQAWFEQYCAALERPAVYTPNSRGAFACPCCRFFTLGARGDYEICPVFFWEDDGQDDRDADVVRGGPNGPLGLTVARANFLAFGACDERSKQFVRPANSEERDGE